MKMCINANFIILGLAFYITATRYIQSGQKSNPQTLYTQIILQYYYTKRDSSREKE